MRQMVSVIVLIQDCNQNPVNILMVGMKNLRYQCKYLIVTNIGKRVRKLLYQQILCDRFHLIDLS